MMSMSLYDIGEQYRALMDMSEEIPEDALRDTLEAIEGEFDIKADDISCLIKDLEGDAKKIAEEVEKLNKRKAAMKKRAAWLRGYLFDQMIKMKRLKIMTPRNVIRIQQHSRPTVKLSPDFIDWAQEHARDDLLRYEIPTANKDAIREALENGEVIPAELVQGEGLVIK